MGKLDYVFQKNKRPNIIKRVGLKIAGYDGKTYSSGQTGASLTRGGYSNPLSGAGGPLDKGDAGLFSPTYINNRQELEVMYVQSWAAKKFIDIPVDDMFIRWRQWDARTKDISEAMREGESEFEIIPRLAKAIKQGRLFGSGLFIVVTKEGQLHQPLDIKKIRKGDLVHFLPIDRFDASVKEIDINPYSKTFQQPLRYMLFPTASTPFEVHASRVIRFDGITSLSLSGFSNYDRYWGISEAVPVILSIMQDQNIAAAAAHLTTEASIPVIKMTGLREALSGYRDPDTPDPSKMASNLSVLKSSWHTMFLDKMDDFERVAVTWSGLSDLMNVFAMRLAAAANIPATRFWGQAPMGMNATGESDMRNYAMFVRSMQIRMLTKPLRIVDEIISRHLGIKEVPKYEWVSLMDMTGEDMAKASKAKMETAVLGTMNDVISRDEGRAVLDGDPVVGYLDPEGREVKPKVPGSSTPGDSNDTTGTKNPKKSSESFQVL